MRGAWLLALTPTAFTRSSLKHGRLHDGPATRCPSDVDLVRRVGKSSACNGIIAAASLTSLFATQHQPVLQGWIAAAGAAVVFGGSSLPAKHPAAAAAGALGFQLWVTIGNAGLNLVLLLLLRVPIRWSAWGVAGAAVLTGTQIFAWPAIQRLGAAVGPGVWCGIGMLTSFGWGVLAFHEKLHSPPLAALALSILIAGVGGVAAAQVVASRRQPDWGAKEQSSSTAKELREVAAENGFLPETVAESGGAQGAPSSRSGAPALPDGPANASPRPSTIAAGMACAIATGLLDGSLMAPFSAYRASVPASDTAALSYLGSFAVALPVVALVPLLLAHMGRDLLSRSPASFWRFFNLPCALSGVATGALWATGNVLSVHATMRLGQAVGFPLTQVCVVVSALWGTLYFGELQHRLALALFCGSSLVVLVGAALLKLGGSGFF